MATDVLVLGPVVFDDWATPSEIKQGGKQAMAVHKLIGGRRVVDTLGPDNVDIQWHGTLWGASAYATAMTLDALRAAGTPLPLFVTGNAYLVVIADFTWTPVRFPQYCTYEITCVVTEAFGLGSLLGGALSLGTLIGADLGAALSLL